MITMTEVGSLNCQGWEVETNGESQRIAMPIEVSKGIDGGILQCKVSRSFYPRETEYRTLTSKQVSKLGNVAGIGYDWYFDVKLNEQPRVIVSLN